MGRKEARLVRAQMQRERDAEAQAEQNRREELRARKQRAVQGVRSEIPQALARLAAAGYPGAIEIRPGIRPTKTPGWRLSGAEAYTLTIDGDLWVNTNRGTKRVTDAMLAHDFVVTDWDYSGSTHYVEGENVLRGLTGLGR